MTIRLIVNADDYGLSANVSRGIRQACSQGIVKSTTCMMNMPTVVDDIGVALRETPGLGLGVHLVLTAGHPLLPADQVSTLVQIDGAFLKLDQLTARRAALDAAQAKAEWRAQIEKFVAAAGRKPTHFDSHHHTSYFTAGLFQSMLELAKEYDVPIRMPLPADMDRNSENPLLEYGPRLMQEFQARHTDACFVSFYDQRATKEELFRIFSGLADGTFEIMSHPGYSDPDLMARSRYAHQRDQELAVLTDAETLAEIKKRNIEVINFSQL